MPVEELRQVMEDQVVKGFVGDGKEFEVDALRGLGASGGYKGRE